MSIAKRVRLTFLSLPNDVFSVEDFLIAMQGLRTSVGLLRTNPNNNLGPNQISYPIIKQKWVALKKDILSSDPSTLLKNGLNVCSIILTAVTYASSMLIHDREKLNDELIEYLASKRF